MFNCMHTHTHTHTRARTHAHTYLRATEVTYVNVFPDDDVPGCGTFRSLSSARDPVAAAFKGVHLRPAAICTGTQTVLYHPAHKHITVPPGTQTVLYPRHTNTSLYHCTPGTQTYHCTPGTQTHHCTPVSLAHKHIIVPPGPRHTNSSLYH